MVNKNVAVKPNHVRRRGQLRESEFVRSLRKMIRSGRMFAFKITTTDNPRHQTDAKALTRRSSR